MKALILAAGRGDRLRPLTDDRPKSLVEIDGRTLLDRQLVALRQAGIRQIGIVRGYHAEMIAPPGVQTFDNPEFDRTNMVWTLFCAHSFFDEDLVIAYADILYEARVLKALLAAKSPVAIVADRSWRDFFERRGEDIGEHAESFVTDGHGRITELGRARPNPAEIEAQYIGLLRVSKETLAGWRQFWRRARAAGDEIPWVRGRSPRRAYMTDFLQAWSDAGNELRAVFVEGGWVELDTIRDLPLVTEWIQAHEHSS